MFHRGTLVAAIAGLFVLSAGLAFAEETASPNDTARFLAGMMPSAGSPLEPLTKQAAWQRHARNFDVAFGRLEKRQLSRVRAWAAKNVTDPTSTMFYMFGGPDFLYANAIYPNAKTYVLAGLEPAGAVPDLTRLRGSLGGNLANLQNSLGSILSYSFFITKRMKTNLRAGAVHGTLPVLYVFLARSGKIVREVTPVAVDTDGVVQPDGSNITSAARGVKIVFAGDDGEARTLYYFSTNLGNGSVKKSGFLKFLEGLAPGDSLIKSASYLLHSGGFATVRDFLLANSNAIVQDDSGIPLRYYARQEWDLHPFGRYLGPIGVFPGKYQRDYAVLFRKSQPINFGIGYRWRSNQSNLMLAVKTAAARSPVAKSEPPTEVKAVPPVSAPADASATPDVPKAQAPEEASATPDVPKVQAPAEANATPDAPKAQPPAEQKAAPTEEKAAPTDAKAPDEEAKAQPSGEQKAAPNVGPKRNLDDVTNIMVPAAAGAAAAAAATAPHVTRPAVQRRRATSGHRAKTRRAIRRHRAKRRWSRRPTTWRWPLWGGRHR